MHPSSESTRLRAIAEDLVWRVTSETPVAGVLLAGSVAEGIADDSSDIDLIVYLDDSADPQGFERFSAKLAQSHTTVQRGHPGFFRMDDVEVQLAPQSVGETTRLIDELLAGQADAVGNLIHQKVAMGLVSGEVLRDGGMVAEWRRRLATFPVALQRAMASHHLDAIFPYWRVAEVMVSRDAKLFEWRSLIDGAFHVLGALSAANRRYYSDFQLKRMRRMIDEMATVPHELATRIEALLVEPQGPALLRDLVGETVAIVEQLVDGTDLTRVRGALGT